MTRRNPNDTLTVAEIRAELDAQLARLGEQEQDLRVQLKQLEGQADVLGILRARLDSGLFGSV